MADNFNLRAFLTENKLTKNAQLLNENEEAPIQGLNLVVLDDQEGGDITLEKYSDMDEEFQQIFNDGLEEGEWEATSLEQGLAELDEYFEERGDPTQQEAYDTAKQQFQSAVQGKQGKFYVHGVEYDLQLMFIESPSQEGEDNLDEASYSDSYDTPAAKKVHGQLSSIVDIFSKSRSEEQQELDAAIEAAEQETGTQVTPTERSVLSQQLNWIRTQDMEMEREGTQNKKPIMKEINLTAKERRLVEMVQDALGEENVDYTMGRQDDPNQLPNPALELNIPEGDEMADETVIPEYHNIDELMKSIDHGTNKVAEEHKIQEMKKIAEALRMKAKNMEESEHAAHISPKDLKQLATDAAKLEKAAEKLKAAFDKKFNKKEKPAAAPKAEKVEALQEGTFDLRKFLAENRK
ncbi:hypothetical protein UFOVP54_50 [uncultured Caudovirales phage]|uniref:Uncharacterized protein n=1 Tax=uncultured Caudovirales phage TaxID=2100421 RepID=A0A6J5KVK7_9CAUD|nr:hypothetical protein UFOVP54_50 [uncultured Caudovirales phage]